MHRFLVFMHLFCALRLLLAHPFPFDSMRSIGMAERAFEYLLRRSLTRTAFGTRLATKGKQRRVPCECVSTTCILLFSIKVLEMQVP